MSGATIEDPSATKASILSSPTSFVGETAKKHSLFSSPSVLEVGGSSQQKSTSTPSQSLRPSVSSKRSLTNVLKNILSSPSSEASQNHTSPTIPATNRNRSAVASMSSPQRSPIRYQTTVGVRSPAVRSPSVRSPAVRSPSVRSPSVRSPSVRSPAVRGPAVRSPMKLFVSDSSISNISNSQKASNSHLIQSSPTKLPSSDCDTKTSPSNKLQTRGNPDSNILDFSNWFSESDANSSVLRSSPQQRKKEHSAKDFTFTLLHSSDPKPKRKGNVRPSTALSDPIETASSSPFRSAAPLPAKRRKIKTTAQGPTPSYPVSDVQYDLKALNEANRSNRTKEELLSSMIIHVPAVLFGAEYMKLKFTKTRLELTNSPNIFWKRSVSSTYDEDADLFVPCMPKELTEKNLIIYVSAEELINKMNENSMDSFLDEYIGKFKVSASTPKPSVILLIEGYDKYVSKLKATQDRLFKEQVRNELAGEDTNARKRKSKNKSSEGLNVEIPLIEKRLNRIQIMKSVNIFYTKSFEDTVDWLHSFTYTIASSLYDNNNYRIGAKVKSGTDTKSTFLKSLQQFKFITEVKAERVYSFYKNLQSLYTTLNKEGTLGKTSGGSNVVPPTTELAMKTFFTSTEEDEVLE
ncbi:hypothetical protein CLIB1423_01S08834 [[Candida] railenensis]|uniref:ERCC4 domain-containing protein n=1 Tax=[Candida] railenensis TaxID=45579 RepID=A0A9P0VWE6_9ASCO|nr:hypothetical protein CLIB1423_01S08834 [[Candida] railenensis]